MSVSTPSTPDARPAPLHIDAGDEKSDAPRRSDSQLSLASTPSTIGVSVQPVKSAEPPPQPFVLEVKGKDIRLRAKNNYLNADFFDVLISTVQVNMRTSSELVQVEVAAAGGEERKDDHGPASPMLASVAAHAAAAATAGGAMGLSLPGQHLSALSAPSSSPRNADRKPADFALARSSGGKHSRPHSRESSGDFSHLKAELAKTTQSRIRHKRDLTADLTLSADCFTRSRARVPVLEPMSIGCTYQRERDEILDMAVP